MRPWISRAGCIPARTDIDTSKFEGYFAWSIDGLASAEGTGPEAVVVTLDGVLDDSVRAQRWMLTFTPQGDVYELTEARLAQRCRPGRGHQGFSPEPCV